MADETLIAQAMYRRNQMRRDAKEWQRCAFSRFMGLDGAGFIERVFGRGVVGEK